MHWASRGVSEQALNEYWKCFGDADRRAAQLELYRSGDFDKLSPYDGKVAELDVPTLLLWGDDDQFAPLAGGHRLKREVPHAELEVIEDTGHFIWDDEPERCGRSLGRFLRGLS
jgi:haloalkane dehalogenase